MALNFASMLLQPTPVQSWNVSGGGGDSSLARQQLALARQRLEFDRQKVIEEKEQARIADAAEKARREALAEKERLDREAKAAADLLAQQQAGVQKFGELAGSGKVEAAQAMVPYLDQLGDRKSVV